MKLFIFLFLLSFTLNAHDDAKKVVFDLRTGNIKVFEKKVLSGISFHKSYYESNLEDLEVAVIIHGDAYKFFIKDLSISRYSKDVELIKEHEKFSKRIKALVEIYEVEFLICESGMKKLQINKNNLYKNINLVATSTVGLIEKQKNSYAYVPID